MLERRRSVQDYGDENDDEDGDKDDDDDENYEEPVRGEAEMVDHYVQFTININVIIMVMLMLKVTVVIGRPRVISPAVSTEEWEVSLRSAAKISANTNTNTI